MIHPKTIYEIDPEVWTSDDKVVCKATITLGDKKYTGTAIAHSEARDFVSEKVGLNIALSRARIQILKEKKAEAKAIYDSRLLMYREATDYGRIKGEEIDPTNRFFTRVIKAKNLYNEYQQTLRRERKLLDDYIKSVGETIKTVRKFRERVKFK